MSFSEALVHIFAAIAALDYIRRIVWAADRRTPRRLPEPDRLCVLHDDDWKVHTSQSTRRYT